MQKQKHWNAKYQCKPQLWSLRARHGWGNFHNISVWGISLPMRIMFFKDDWDNICYSACHLYHEIPKSEPRKPPRKLSHTRSRIERARKKRGTVGRKTIWGKNLSAAQLEATTEKKGHQGQLPSQRARDIRSDCQTEEATEKTPPNHQKRSRLILSRYPNFKCRL